MNSQVEKWVSSAHVPSERSVFTSLVITEPCTKTPKTSSVFGNQAVPAVPIVQNSGPGPGTHCCIISSLACLSFQLQGELCSPICQGNHTSSLQRWVHLQLFCVCSHLHLTQDEFSNKYFGTIWVFIWHVFILEWSISLINPSVKNRKMQTAF